MSEIVFKHPIVHDDYTAVAEQMFDIPHTDESVSVIQNNIHPPSNWNIGLIYGPSGSGKTSLLHTFGPRVNYVWDGKAVISNFKYLTPEEVTALFCSVGFGDVPSWLRPFHMLSNGEQFRCNVARAISGSASPILIDEFTSVVDRNVAKSASNAVQKYVRKTGKKVILASCHSDIIDWLSPDWIYNPTEALTHVLPRGSLQRPPISLKIFRSKYEAWNLFKSHHYLSADLNKAARCFLVTWNDNPVAFSGVLAHPSPHRKNCWRESRTVVLPDFQGLGIGVKLSDYIGSLVRAGGGAYYSKTIHPAMIAYRLKSGIWVETAHSRRHRKIPKSNPYWLVTNRFCYSFEYRGASSTPEEAKLFWEDSMMGDMPQQEINELTFRDKDLLRKKLYRLRKKLEGIKKNV